MAENTVAAHGVNGESLRSRTFRDGLSIQETKYSAGLMLPVHAHEQHLLSLVVRGGLDDHCRQRDHSITRKEFLISPAGESHRTTFHGNGAIVLNVIVDPHWLMTNAPGHDPSLFYGRKDKAAHIARELYEEFDVDDEMSEIAIVGTVLQLLATSTRLRKSSGNPAWTTRIIDCVSDRTAGSPDLDELAAEAGVHRSTLCAGFRRATGMTIGQYARAARLNSARDYLADRKHSIAWIALECGFADQAHLCRSFRRAFGVTPSQFRKQRGLD